MSLLTGKTLLTLRISSTNWNLNIQNIIHELKVFGFYLTEVSQHRSKNRIFQNIHLKIGLKSSAETLLVKVMFTTLQIGNTHILLMNYYRWLLTMDGVELHSRRTGVISKKLSII